MRWWLTILTWMMLLAIAWLNYDTARILREMQ